jgi:hypothetical protein
MAQITLLQPAVPVFKSYDAPIRRCDTALRCWSHFHGMGGNGVRWLGEEVSQLDFSPATARA